MTADLPADSTFEAKVVGGFADWLHAAGGSLAVTTYQANKLLLVGFDGPRLTFLPRHFDKPMGLAAGGGRLLLATRHELLLLADAPLLARDYRPDRPGAYDALYLPRACWYTGDLNVHDVALTPAGPLVVNTRFGCLSRPSFSHAFEPTWHPPFLTELAPEDRCHLNGLACAGGEPRYVTVLGETDAVGGWRPGKATGGAVLEVPGGRVVVRGLAMPHSPRLHRGVLYVLNSGAGELLAVDPAAGKADVVATLPAYLRGLCLVGDVALVGLCKVRERHLFGGLPVQDRFKQLHCGVAAVELAGGRTLGVLEFTAGVSELFEVAFLPGVRRPMVLRPDQEAARQAFPAPAFSYWLRPENERTG